MKTMACDFLACEDFGLCRGTGHSVKYNRYNNDSRLRITGLTESSGKQYECMNYTFTYLHCLLSL